MPGLPEEECDVLRLPRTWLWRWTPKLLPLMTRRLPLRPFPAPGSLQLTAPGSPILPQLRADLGGGPGNKARFTGETELLEEALPLLRSAIVICRRDTVAVDCRGQLGSMLGSSVPDRS